jgi:hypothetical protein
MSFIQPIIYLVLVIAVGAVGANFIDDGVLGFKDKAKAQGVVELADDIKTAMDTFKADQASSLSLPFVIDSSAALQFSDVNTDDDSVVDYQLVVNALKSDGIEYISGNAQPDFGVFGLGIGTDEKVYIINSSDLISDEICEKINEVTGYVSPGQVDVVGVLPTAAGVEVTTASIDAALALAFTVADETVKAACIESDGVNGSNTFVYFLQDF